MSMRLLVVGPDDSIGADPDGSAVVIRALKDEGVSRREVALRGPQEVTQRGLAFCDGVLLDPGEDADPALLAHIASWCRVNRVPMLAAGDGSSAVVDDHRQDLGMLPEGVAPAFWRRDPATAALLREGWVLESIESTEAPDVLRLPAHPFFVATPHHFVTEPGPGTLLGWLVAATRSRSLERELESLPEENPEHRTGGRPYVHQMRGPGYKWWRPLVALAVFVASFIALGVDISLPFMLTGSRGAEDLAQLAVDPLSSPWLNLVLVVLIPASILGAWAAYGSAPWRLFSVDNRLRWGWLGRCALVVGPIWLVYLAVSWLAGDGVRPEADQSVTLTAVTLLVATVHTAGGEVAFRGLLVQAVGAWIPSASVAAVVTTIVSATAFGFLLGSLDPWSLLAIFSLSVAASYLAWRTGGIESSIAIQFVNTLLMTFHGVAPGGLEDAYIGGPTTASPIDAVIGIAVVSLATGALVRLARRRGLAHGGWLTPTLG
jgi:hypothetical protein